MVIAALLYAGIANLVAHKLGRPLAGLSATQQHREADFRFGLARLRDVAIEVALLGGAGARPGSLPAASPMSGAMPSIWPAATGSMPCSRPRSAIPC
ncbi:hypothetical protein ACFQ4K_05900 [Tistrella bauzanensis]